MKPETETLVTNKFLLGVILAIVSIFGYVALAFSGLDNVEQARGVFLFTTPFIAILLGSSALERLQEKTDKIGEQTNGHLTKKIEDTANAAAENAVRKHLESQLPTTTEEG